MCNPPLHEILVNTPTMAWEVDLQKIRSLELVAKAALCLRAFLADPTAPVHADAPGWAHDVRNAIKANGENVRECVVMVVLVGDDRPLFELPVADHIVPTGKKTGKKRAA